jgi:hypothetical protein
VLSGEIVASNYTLQTSDRDNAVNLFRLSDADDSLKKMTDVVDKVEFLENNRVHIKAGGMHYVHENLMHRVTSPLGAITLMLTGTPTKNHSDVIKLMGANKGRQRIDREECISAVLDACENVE